MRLAFEQGIPYPGIGGVRTMSPGCHGYFFGRLMLDREGGSVRGSSGQLCFG